MELEHDMKLLSSIPVVTGIPASAMRPEPDLLMVEAFEVLMDAFLRKESALRSIILGSIPPRIQNRLLNCTRAADLWSGLCKLHEDQNAVIQAHLLARLHRIETPEGGDPLKTIEEILTGANDYSAAGGYLTDQDVGAILINAVPSKYHAVIQSVMTNASIANTKFSLPVLISNLEDSIKLDQMKEERERTQQVAMQAKWKEYQKAQTQNGQAKGKSAGKKTKDVDCYNCNKSGHIKADCWREGGGKEGEGPNQNGGKGKKRGNGKGKGNAKASTNDQDVPIDHAFAAIDPGIAFKSSSTMGTVVRLLDTAASQHFEPDKSNFIKLEACEAYPIEIADGKVLNATEKGTILFSYHLDGETKTISLSNVYYAPWISSPLISVARLREYAGLAFSNASKGFALVKDPKGEVIFKVTEKYGVYPLTTWRPVAGKVASAARKPITLQEAHLRLNHVSYDVIRQMVRSNQVLGFEVDLSTPEDQCRTCIEAKATRTVVQKAHEGQRSSSMGQVVSSDVWGPARTTAKGGYRYFSTWTDNYSRFTHVYLQKSKAETFEKYKQFEAWMTTQHEVSIAALHSDRGGEYTSGEFDQHLARKGTRRSLTAHDTPEHNGVAERLNYTLANLVRAMLVGSGLPKSLWSYALMNATWLKNRIPTSALGKEGKTPFEMVYGRKPDLSRAREWGCKVMVKVKNEDKLDARAEEARYLGPSGETSDGFHIYWPKTGRVTVERNVRFLDGSAFEGELGASSGVPTANPFENEPSNPAQNAVNEAPTQDTPPNRPTATAAPPKGANNSVPSSPNNSSPSSTVADPLEAVETPEESSNGPRRSQRVPKPSDYVRRVLAGESETKTLPVGMRAPQGTGHGASAVGAIGHAKAAVNVDMIGRQPRTLDEAKRRPDGALYEKAAEIEFGKIGRNDTWELVPREEADAVLDVKWVFDGKFNAEGEQTEVKGRLVVRGDQQELFVNYNETSSPVFKSVSKNIVLSLAARTGWEVRQGDFKSAYLNGELGESEIIYVKQPPGFVDPDKPNHVYRLKKALYGMKQAGRIWYKTISAYLLETLGFTRSEADHSLFYRHRTNGNYLFLGLYVDDPLMVGSDLEEMLELEEKLDERFPFKALGDAVYYLGTTIERDREAGTISLGQAHYIDAAIACARLEQASPTSTPLPLNQNIGKEFCPSNPDAIADMANIPFRELIGMLMYIANGTRPDIACSVNKLAQVASNPGRVHWNAAKHMVRYLKGTRDQRLTFGCSSEGLIGYTDASHGAEDLGWKSMSGYVFTIGGAAVSWSAKKQPIIALSSAESEYIAMTHASKEIIWIRTLLSEILRPLQYPTPLFADSQSAIAMAHNDTFHPRTKHIALRYHFIRQCIEDGNVALTWVSTHHNLADIFTKALDTRKTSVFAFGLGLRA
jgi:hypothetical protein